MYVLRWLQSKRKVSFYECGVLQNYVKVEFLNFGKLNAYMGCVFK